MNGSQLILQERNRQISAEGFSPEHDATHSGSELIEAAICYAVHAVQQARSIAVGQVYERPISWSWEDEWWKPSPDPVRNLVKAGALIAAEIDRLQRQQQSVT